MSNLEASLRLLDEADQTQSSSEAIHALRSAAVHAILDVAEHQEYAGEQLARIADGLEALIEHLRGGQGKAVPGCDGCEHGTHPGRRCLVDVIVEPGALAECGCRWQAEQ